MIILEKNVSQNLNKIYDKTHIFQEEHAPKHQSISMNALILFLKKITLSTSCNFSSKNISHIMLLSLLFVPERIFISPEFRKEIHFLSRNSCVRWGGTSVGRGGPSKLLNYYISCNNVSQ